MAILFSRAAKYRVEAMRTRMQSDTALEACDARLGLRFRARAGSRQGKAPTEAYFKAKIVLNSAHKRLAKAKEDATYREELAKLILDAYRMRRDAIKIIADHQLYPAVCATEANRISSQSAEDVRRMCGHWSISALKSFAEWRKPGEE